MRVALVSERWESVTDEGMLGYLDHIAKHIKDRGELLVLFEHGDAQEDASTRRVPMGKGLVTGSLKHHLEAFGPELVIYCPTACATINALLRHRRLQRAMGGVPCALLSLQHRPYRGLRASFAKRLRPWRLIVLSRRAEEMYRRWGFDTLRIPVGVDLAVFRPVEAERRMELRRELGIDSTKRVVLHVGHLTANRGLERLKELASLPELQLIVIASTANEADLTLKNLLSNSDIHLVHEYVPGIERYYQASDLYIFPVRDSSGSIEFPLSVLEAMACNLRVLSTRFGALPEHFSPAPGFRFLGEDGEDLGAAVREVLEEEPRTRALVEDFDWSRSIGRLMDQLLKEATG